MSTADAPGAALAGIGVTVSGLLGPLLLTDASLSGAVARLRNAGAAADRIRTSAGQAAEELRKIRSDAEATARALTTGAGGARTAAAGWKSFAAKAKGLKGTLSGLGSGLGGVLSLLGGLASVSPPVTKLMNAYGKAATVVGDVMTAVNLLSKTTPLGFITGLLLPLASSLIDMALNSQAGQRILQQVFDQALQLFQQIVTLLGPVLKVLGDIVATYVSGYLTVILGVLTVVTALLSGDFPAVSAAVAKPAKALHDLVSTAWNGLKNAVQPALDFLTRDLPKAFQRVKDAMARALNAIGGFLSTGLQAVVSVMKAPLSGLIAFANWIIDGLNSIGFSFLGKHFGVHLDKIPMLAAGGVVLPATARGAGRVLPLAALDRRRLLPAGRGSGQSGGPYRLAEFHEKPADGPRGIAEDLLFLAASAQTAHPAGTAAAAR